MSHALVDWLNEDDALGQFNGQQFPGSQPPPDQTSITNQNSEMPPEPDEMDLQADPQTPTQPELPDVNADPVAPDMPEDHEDQDFEQWKDQFFRESIKGDIQKLIDMINQVRDLDLDSYPRKFVEDNLQVLFLRQYANVDRASKEIRRLIKEELDQNNPSVSIVNHINNVLGTMPELNNVFIKLKGALGMKADLHRKFIAALIGGVQVGSGAAQEDVIYNERDYSVRLSTRYNDKFGKVDLGRWSLREDDPKRYLTDPEQRRLQDGSPEEKDVLRRRIVMESICESFKKRAFVINVVGNDGTIYLLGWDLAGSLRAAYSAGKLVIRTIESENSEAMIDNEGSIIPFIDLKVMYIKDTGEIGPDGKPDKEEHEFMERIDGILFLTSRLNILKEAASSFQGIVMKEIPYAGNPSDVKLLMRCFPSITELLMKNC